MANPLTGDYEAVVQIAVRQINGLLGTLHQNADNDTPLKLLHSMSMRIGDPRRRLPDVTVFGDWVIAYQRAARGEGFNGVRAQLTSNAPPGAAKRFTEAFVGIDQDWDIQLPPDVVRGLGKMQVSTVAISVPDGSSSEVTAHAHVRVVYYPDSGTTELPTPLHGEVRAVFDVSKQSYSGGRRLLIRPSADDTKIRFTAASGSGLTAIHENLIAVEVRKVLRQGLRLLPVDLPTDFRFAEFKGIGSGANQVIALPFQLSGAEFPASGPQSLTQSFIGSSGFGFAVSQEHVKSLIDLAAIREAISRTTFKALGATYRLRFSSGPSLTFRQGVIEVAGRVEAETSALYLPNGFVSFTQRLTLVLDTASQTISLERRHDDEVDESWFIPHSTAVNTVRSEIIKAIEANRPTVRRIFEDARGGLNTALGTFDRAASAAYTSVEITPHGVVVRGEIRSPARGAQRRRAPVVKIAETHHGAAFTALECWIPAGRIDRFIWTWVEYTGVQSIWSGVEKSAVDEHQFILPKPVGVSNASQICLRVEGAQNLPSGLEVSAVGGTTCQVPEPEFGLPIPSWWEPLTIPFWRPELADTGALRAAIAGHISVQTSSPVEGRPLRTALVYFIDGRADRPLDTLLRALSQLRNSAAVVTTVVLPPGTFDARRRDVEAMLSISNSTTDTPINFTEDDEGGWTRTFGVSRAPSAYLINPRGEFVWNQEGHLDPAAIAAAVDKYNDLAGPPAFRPLTLTVEPGDAAPNVVFDDSGNHYALHRLRGRVVILNFWQSWSAPCITELERLQRMRDTDAEVPFIAAFHGGANGGAIKDVSKRLKLSFPLVQDMDQIIARKYGVRCWPTTITIDVDGQIDHVQYGMAHEHSAMSTQS